MTLIRGDGHAPEDAAGAREPRPQPFSLLRQLYADDEMAEIFSERSTVAFWLATEAALAAAEAEVGILTAQEADAIAAACSVTTIDLPKLWRESRVVGYPVLPLVRAISAQLPEGPNGRVHYGATTQDIMDTALSLQLNAALTRLESLVNELGNRLAEHAAAHVATVMAARTHAQQAVPTTFGAKLATYLDELARHRRRLAEMQPRVAAVSLFGAGGTGAALGSQSSEIRRRLAARLELHHTDVPRHVARDGIAEFGFLCAAIAATCARFAGEVIALSRTEIDELVEGEGRHRGASSTMPQKANPVLSEAVIGLSATAQALVGPLLRAMQPVHERAAGEWQIEWEVVPLVAVLAAGALTTSGKVAAEMRVRPERMLANASSDHGGLLAEAYMMTLAPTLGRERAHDLVYDAFRLARERDVPLHDAIGDQLADAGLLPDRPLEPEDYLGETERICESALARWRTTRR